MNELLLVLTVTFGSVVLGYVIRVVPAPPLGAITENRARISKALKIGAIFVLNPIPIINSFWGLSLSHGILLTFPFLGILSVSIGGASAIVLNHLFRIPPKRAASVFIAGAFTNIISLGGLVVFAFYGHDGYALVPLFNTFVSFAYYAFGYPISHQLSLENRERFSFSSGVLLERPYLLIPLASILIGTVLNLAGTARPAFLEPLAGFLIPVISTLIGLSIGLSLSFGRIGAYRKEVMLVSIIKFMIVPALMIPLGITLGLPNVGDGLAFNVLIILSVMPVAFNALIPPVVYGFDLDLANSAWVVTTSAVGAILPLLYIVLIR